jgi:putative PIN family toxin of toxin-antitoxin system
MNFDRPLVIDTGVLVSAAIRPESIPALAFEKALSQFDPCFSEETLQELKTVLLRPKFERYLSRTTRQRFLDEFMRHTIVFPVTEIVTDCRDAKDNKFLARAAAVDSAGPFGGCRSGTEPCCRQRPGHCIGQAGEDQSVQFGGLAAQQLDAVLAAFAAIESFVFSMAMSKSVLPCRWVKYSRRTCLC